MSNIYATLGQVLSTASTLTDLYTVPSSTNTVASSLVVCNQGVTATFRVAVRKVGASIDPKQYLIYDMVINANDTISLALGITLAQTDVVSVYASSSTISFNLFGTELI